MARQLIAPRAPRADVAAQVETLTGGPGPDHVRPLSRSQPTPSLPPQTLGEDRQSPSPTGLLRRTGTGDQKIGLINLW